MIDYIIILISFIIGYCAGVISFFYLIITYKDKLIEYAMKKGLEKMTGGFTNDNK